VPSTHRTIRRSSLVASIVLVLAACGGGDEDDSATSTSTAASQDAVAIRLVAFQPDRIEVVAGTTVTWTNEDPGAHTVTSGEVEDSSVSPTQTPDGVFASGQLETDESFEFAFDEPGTYSYFCELHPATMRAVVVVS
jgi:plastocyanin